MPNTYSPKDPSDIRRYSLDFEAAMPAGATLAGVTSVAFTGGLSAPVGPLPAHGVDGSNPTVAYAWATGGTLAATATIVWTVTTSGGETLQRTATVLIKDR